MSPTAALPTSASAVSLADAPDAVAPGGVRDVAAPGQPLSRTRPLRSVEEAGSTPLLWIPALNRGTAFTRDQRAALRLEGLLPPAVETIDQAADRVLWQLRTECAGPFERYSRLQWLAATNATLFFHTVIHNIEMVAPLIYTPTVGEACQKYSGHFRAPAGLFVDAVHGRDRFAACVANWPNHNAQVAVITDGSRILGLGDLGVGGMGISVGKIQLYVAGGGFHPDHSLPVMLDAGTANADLLADPHYLGVRAPRLPDAAVVDAVDDLCAALVERYPHILIQFEDFASEKAFAILDRCRSKYLCFNDDIQGTGAVVCAGFLNGMRAQGTPLAAARVAFFGAGSSAVGVAETIAAAVAAETGETLADARRRIYLIDSKGLVTTTRGDVLAPHKRALARTDGTPDTRTLVDVVRLVQPHALIGLSGVGGAFTRDALAALAAGTPRPLVMPCSNPTSAAECTPAQAYEWTGGAAMVATGSPFDPVTLADGSVRAPGQANNFLTFPAVGLGAVLVKARSVTDGMLLASARALAATVPDADVAAGTLYPPLAAIRATTLAVAAAVADAAYADGVAGVAPRPPCIVTYISDRMYWPDGRPPAGWADTVAAVARAHKKGQHPLL